MTLISMAFVTDGIRGINRTETHNFHSFPARHNPNSEKTDTLRMLSRFTRVEKRTHGQSSSIGPREIERLQGLRALW